MKTVLFFARDPGGANVVLPVYGKMKGTYRTLLYAKETALDKFRRENCPVEDIEPLGVKTYGDVLAFLKKMHPDAIITGTSLDDFMERYFWKAAETLHIKSFAILDQWVNLGIRFSDYDYSRKDVYDEYLEHPYLPYRIFVMDELAKEQLERGGISGEKIVLTGQPHFDMVCERFQYASRVYDEKLWNVIFVSEPLSQNYDNGDDVKPYWGYNEKTILNALCSNLHKLAECHSRKIRLIIRPHPREGDKNWKQVIDELGNENVRVEVDNENDSFSLIKSADLVCGMSSMFLLESAICGKPILSIEIGLKRENPFVLDKMGYCKSVLTEEELFRKLDQVFLDGGKKISENTRGGVCGIGYPKGVENATDKIISLIEEEIGR